MAAAGRWKAYDLLKFYMGKGVIDFSNTANFKVALFLSTSNCNNLSVGTGLYGDLTNEVANAFGYTTGGLDLTTETWVNSAGVITFDTDNAVWTASGGSITARFAVIYINATVLGIVKPLVCVSLLDTAPADRTATDGNMFTITMSASGILTQSGATID